MKPVCDLFFLFLRGKNKAKQKKNMKGNLFGSLRVQHTLLEEIPSFSSAIGLLYQTKNSQTALQGPILLSGTFQEIFVVS